MNRVLDYLFGKTDDDSVTFARWVRDSGTLLEGEAQVMDFMIEFQATNETFPTFEYVNTQFPEVVISSESPWGLAEVTDHWRRKSSNRRKQQVGRMMAEAGNAIIQGEDPSQYRDMMDQIYNNHHDGSSDPIALRDLSEINLLDEIAQREPPKIQFGVEDIDAAVKGIEPGIAVVIGGYVGNFKSSFGISMCVHNAIRGYSSAILSLERPPLILKVQALSNFSFTQAWTGSPIPHLEILKATLNEEQKEELRACEAAMAEIEGKVEIFGGFDVKPDLITGLPRACKWLADRGHRMLLIDHVQLTKYYMRSTSEVHGVDRFVKEITDTATELNDKGYDFRVVFLSQINREGYRKAMRRGGQYDLTALAEYNELERSGSYIVTLFATDELKAVNELRFQLLKHSFGPTIEEPISVFVDPTYAMVGGVQAMMNFDMEDSEIGGLLSEDYGI